MIAWSKKIGYKVWYLKTGEELTKWGTGKNAWQMPFITSAKGESLFFILKGN